MSEINAVSDETFEREVIGSPVPVVVDFWAPWCGPCKAMGPLIDDLAVHFAGRVKFVKMDVDQSPVTPSKFGVRGIPTLILFISGEVAATQVGLISKADLIKFVESHIEMFKL